MQGCIPLSASSPWRHLLGGCGNHCLLQQLSVPRWLNPAVVGWGQVLVSCSPPRGWGCRRLGVASHLGPWAPRGAVSHSCAGETLWAPTEDGQNLASSISRELPEPVNPCIAERGGTPANILEDLVMIDASEKHYPKQFPHDLGSQRHFETLWDTWGTLISRCFSHGESGRNARASSRAPNSVRPLPGEEITRAGDNFARALAKIPLGFSLCGLARTSAAPKFIYFALGVEWTWSGSEQLPLIVCFISPPPPPSIGIFI